jgi:hypothetical protein
LATYEDNGKVNFIYAFPYLDVFTIKLTVRDSALNEDSEIKTYIVDEYPISGGGAPPIHAMAENYQEPMGEIHLVDWHEEDAKFRRTIIKAKKVYEADSDGMIVIIKAELSEKN